MASALERHAKTESMKGKILTAARRIFGVRFSRDHDPMIAQEVGIDI